MNIKDVKIGNLIIGKNKPIRVQSMTNTNTEDLDKTIKQIAQLKEAGAEIVRISIPSIEAANNIREFKKHFPDLPLVADIHFDYKLALLSIEKGIDKLRINPGNIKNKKHIALIVKSAKEKNIPVRIGINGGSLPDDILRKYNDKLTPEGMVEAAEREIVYFEELDYYNIVVSLKASDVLTTVKANELFRKKFSYPLHIGITEAGTHFNGTIASSVGLGILLYEGIGETIRVSLSADPVEEVKVAYKILKNLNLRKYGVTLHSCPTCSRTEINVIGISSLLEKALNNVKKDITIAVMGCVVNGPGEALHSDIGVVGTRNFIVIYKKGKIIKQFKKDIKMEKIINFIKRLLDD